MVAARLSIALTLLVIGTMSATAEETRLNPNVPDQLTSSEIVLGYQDKERQDIARGADALVRASPTFAPGYVVGVMHSRKSWRLIGRGNQAKGPSPAPSSEASCSRPIDEKLGHEVIALWGKALATMGSRSKQTGLDGESFTFSLKEQGQAGEVWSPDLRNQPKMFRLAQIADGLFDACLTGRDQGELIRQMSELSSMM